MITRNQYNYFLKRRLERYRQHEKKYNLTHQIVADFAKYLESGDLKEIKKLFATSTIRQKEGLLTFYYDFNDFSKKPAPFAYTGYPIHLAKQFGFSKISEFLISEKNTFIGKGLFGLFHQHKLPYEVCASVMASPLNFKDGNRIAQTNRAASIAFGPTEVKSTIKLSK